MKLIIYKDQKKFTIDKVAFSRFDNVEAFLADAETSEVSLDGLALYDLHIQSVNADIYEDEAGIGEEDDEGIIWQQETVQ